MSLWTYSYDVTIQMKALFLNFDIVDAIILFVKILENEIWKFGRSQRLSETSLVDFFAWYNFLWIFSMNFPWQLLGVNGLL